MTVPSVLVENCIGYVKNAIRTGLPLVKRYQAGRRRRYPVRKPRRPFDLLARTLLGHRSSMRRRQDEIDFSFWLSDVFLRSGRYAFV